MATSRGHFPRRTTVVDALTHPDRPYLNPLVISSCTGSAHHHAAAAFMTRYVVNCEVPLAWNSGSPHISPYE